MGDGESTGVLTGIEREVLDRVRLQCVELAEVLRASAEQVNEQLVPLTTQTAIDDWVSSARVTYDLGRSTIITALSLAGLACGYIAAHYDDAVWLIDQQLRLEFA